MKLNICLPGNTFTQRFVKSFHELTRALDKNKKIDYELFFYYSSDIYMCRNEILQVRNRANDNHFNPLLPFGGHHYDYALWIDSDIQFSVENVMQLIKDDKDIVSGMVRTGTDENIGAGRFVKREDGVPGVGYLQGNYNYKELLEMDFCGFAFVLIKHGVFEKIGYPWFQSVVLDANGMPLITSEDVGFCHRAQEAGFQIWVDPRVRLGHEKQLVLWAGGKE